MSIVLVIEDDVTAAAVIELTLGLDGHVVDTAGTLAEAHAALEVARPDLILLDLTLPDGHGLDLLAHLSSEPGPVVPVIVVSGLSHDRTIARAFELGAADYIVKPFSPVELGARAARVLEMHARMVA